MTYQRELSSARLREASLGVVVLNFDSYIVFYYVYMCGREHAPCSSSVEGRRHPQKHPYPLHQCLKSGTFVSKVGSASELLLASDEVIHHLIHTVSLLIIFPHLYIIHCLIIFSGEYFANTCMRIPALVLLLRNMTLDISGSMPDTC